MSRSFVREDRRKWDALMQTLPQLQGAEVKVGIQSDAGAYPDGGPPLAVVAFYNEFGTQGRSPRRGGWGGPIPPRPFLRDTSDEKRAEWNRMADRVINAAITGRSTLRQGLERLGEKAEGDIKMGILRGGWARNSPMTVALKGSATPLINEGTLRGAIRYEVRL